MRHDEGQEGDVGLVRHRRRHAAVIVAGNNENTTARRTAISIAVLECIAGTIHARSLAVPDAKHTVEGLVGIRFNLLCAEYRGRREVFVYRGQKLDVVLGKKLFGPPQLLIVGAERGAPVTGDKTRRVQPGRAVHRPLH